MPLRLQEKENITAKFSAADLFEFASLAFVLPIDLAVARRDISDYLVVVLPYIGDIIAYTDGLHFCCQEVYPYRNQNKV